MIGSLRGRLAAKHAPHIVLECNGVGYDVETPMSTFLDLPELGVELFLHTHLLVREDAQILYGFATEEERALFRTLLKVNRVGAKLALGILSGISVEGFIRCVQEEDKGLLSKLPGVGKKTAERLIMDMRDRIDAQATVLSISAVSSVGAAGETGARREAFTALTSLGYKPAEARRMLDGVDEALSSTEDILRAVLQSAAPAGG